jgi:hypothetical protein
MAFKLARELCRFTRRAPSPRFRARHVDQVESKHPMNKRQLIDDIRRINPTAQALFLAQFDEAALRDYLDHLNAAIERRVRISGWVRKRPRAVRLAS